MKYCKNCKQKVQPIKKFSWVWFLVFLGVFYLPYYLFFKTKVCPICNAHHFGHAPGEIDTTTLTPKEIKQAKFEQSCEDVHDYKLKMKAKLEEVRAERIKREQSGVKITPKEFLEQKKKEALARKAQKLNKNI